jgi:hypothetical protein
MVPQACPPKIKAKPKPVKQYKKTKHSAENNQPRISGNSTVQKASHGPDPKLRAALSCCKLTLAKPSTLARMTNPTLKNT